MGLVEPSFCIENYRAIHTGITSQITQMAQEKGRVLVTSAEALPPELAHVARYVRGTSGIVTVSFRPKWNDAFYFSGSTFNIKGVRTGEHPRKIALRPTLPILQRQAPFLTVEVFNGKGDRMHRPHLFARVKGEPDRQPTVSEQKVQNALDIGGTDMALYQLTLLGQLVETLSPIPAGSARIDPSLA